MKKTFKHLLIVLFFCLVFFILLNLFDADLTKKSFTENDLLTLKTEPNNGFYILFSLYYPPDKDIFTDQAKEQVKQLMIPGKTTAGWLEKYKQYYLKFRSESISWDRVRIPVPREANADWIQYFKTRLKKLHRQLKNHHVLLTRYNRFLASKYVADITPVRIYSPIPDRDIWTNAAKLFLSDQIIKIFNKNFKTAVINIINHINFTSNLINTSRDIATNRTAKSINNLYLKALASVLNQPDCPSEVLSQVTILLPTLKTKHFGSRNAIVYEYLCIKDFLDATENVRNLNPFSLIRLTENRSEYFLYRIHIENKDRQPWFNPFLKLLLQKNRTTNYFSRYAELLIKMEKTRPYLWQNNPFRLAHGITSSFGWWIQNPMGKILLKNFLRPWFIYRSYELKARHDMVRIVADLRLKYRFAKTGLDTLDKTILIKTIDPFSGNPYILNRKKGVLYSVGVNGQDDNGIEKHIFYKNSDIVVPCIIK